MLVMVHSGLGEHLLDYQRRPETDMEVCTARQGIETLAYGWGLWRGLAPELRRKQLEQMGINLGQRAGKGEGADDDDDEEVVAAEAAAAGGAGGGGAPPRWVICGARSAVKRARVLLAACDAHVVERLGGASIEPLRYIEPASVPVGS